MACILKYLTGDYKSFDNINFKVVIKHGEEREEIRFIKHDSDINEIFLRKEWLDLEKKLDNDGIAAWDVFEYGLCLMVEYWNYKDIYNVLTMLISFETDPVRINFALAKKDSVKMIYEGEHPEIIKQTLSAYFNDDIRKACLVERD